MKNEIKNACISWGEQILSEDEQLYACGDLVIAVIKAGKEIWIKHSYTDISDSKATWQRWGSTGELSNFILSPIFPDKPIVVKPEYPFTLVKGATAKIYVRIPVNVKLVFGQNKEKFYYEIPSIVLSNTWFGDFMSGELCYWLSSKARREVLLEKSHLNYAICPVIITNKSNEELNVEKIRLQVTKLSLFLEDNFLWSTEIRVSYRGGGIVSAVDFSNVKPSDVKTYTSMFPARESGRKKGMGSTFGAIFDMASFGLFSD